MQQIVGSVRVIKGGMCLIGSEKGRGRWLDQKRGERGRRSDLERGEAGGGLNRRWGRRGKHSLIVREGGEEGGGFDRERRWVRDLGFEWEWEWSGRGSISGIVGEGIGYEGNCRLGFE